MFDPSKIVSNLSMADQRTAYQGALAHRQALIDQGYKQRPTSYGADNYDEARRVFHQIDTWQYPNPKLLFIPPNPDANINALDDGRYVILTIYRFGGKYHGE